MDDEWLEESTAGMNMSAQILAIEGLSRESGHCWWCRLPRDVPRGDSPETPYRSTLRLFENGREIGPAHSLHDDIRRLGGGRFSHWERFLYLSPSEGKDGEVGKRSYLAIVAPDRDTQQQQLLAAAAEINPKELNSSQRYDWGEQLFSLFVDDAKLSEWARSYFLETDFLADYERFEPRNHRSLDRKFALKEFAKLALKRPGDMAECGVFRGASSFFMAKAAQAMGTDKKIHLFDSFCGLSEPTAVDGDYWQRGGFACDQREVRRNLAPFAGRLVFHPGWIPSRFADVADTRFCLVHIDVDLFQPTWDSLAFFYPRMTAGGVIVCDDYGFETCPGARKAVDEFFAGKIEPPLHLPTGQCMVLIDGGSRTAGSLT